MALSNHITAARAGHLLKTRLFGGLLCTLLGIAAFANALQGELVLDDRPFLLDNAHLSGVHEPAFFFSEHTWQYSNLPPQEKYLYRPLFFASLWLVNRGWPGSPAALHGFSLALHIAATLLLLAALPRFLPGISPLASSVGAGIFAVHPVHSEAIAWISAFIHPMATVFLLASFLAHDRHIRSHETWPLILASLLFALALLTNEAATAYPFFILFYNRMTGGRFRLSSAMPYVVLLGAYAIVRNIVTGATLPFELTDAGTWLSLPVFLVEYFRHLVMPWPQPIFLSMPENWGLTPASLIIAVLSGLCVLFLIRSPGPNRRAALMAIAWIAAALLPLMGAAFNADARFSLRSLYLASVGISILAAGLVDSVPKRLKVPGLALLCILVAGSLAANWTANRYWQNDGQVYSRIVKYHPGFPGGHEGLATYYERNGNAALAIQKYEDAARLEQGKAKAEPLERLGYLLGSTGNNQRSLEIYKQVLALDPQRASAWIGVGNNLWHFGRLEEALSAYRRAYDFDPESREACTNLALTLKQLGRAREASRFAACGAN